MSDRENVAEKHRHNQDLLCQPKEVSKALEELDCFMQESAERERTDLLDRMFSTFYDELRRRAHQIFKDGRRYTKQPTDLLGDLWVKLRRQGVSIPDDPQHFRAFAAQALRWVFQDYMRKKERQGQRLELDNEAVTAKLATQPRNWPDSEGPRQSSLTRLHHALERLEQETNPRRQYSLLISLKYFGGLSEQQLADYFGVPRTTIKGRLYQARRRLKRYLDESSETR